MIQSFPSSLIPSGERRGLSTGSTPGRNVCESFSPSSDSEVSGSFEAGKTYWYDTSEIAMTGQAIIDSRRTLPVPDSPFVKQEAEGGCGVVGLASNVPLGGRYLLESLMQTRNRGNGKGEGIAGLGLVPEQLGVSQEIRDEDYILQVAYLDKSARKQVEDEHIRPFFRVDYESRVEAVDDYRSIPGL